MTGTLKRHSNYAAAGSRSPSPNPSSASSPSSSHPRSRHRVPVLAIVVCMSLLLCVLAALLIFTNVASSFPSSSTSSSSSMSAASSAIKARAKAAVLGGLVADAATMPLHWLYDVPALTTLVGDNDPAFFSKPSCPFYTYEVGKLSPYGDELLPLLRHLAAGEKKGFESSVFAQESLNFLKAYTGRLNHVSKLFVEAMEAGKTGEDAAVDDSQAHGIIKVPLLVSRYAGSPLLLPKVEEAVLVHQKNDLSVSSSLLLATILNRLVLEGGSVADAAAWAVSESSSGLSDEQRALVREITTTPYPRPEKIKEFGLSCALPGALKGALYTAIHASSYAEAVRFSILAGGDNCSRNICIGALLGAAMEGGGGGGGGIPEEWKEKMKAYAEVEALSENIVGQLE